MMRKIETRPLPWVMGKPDTPFLCAVCMHRTHRGEIRRTDAKEAIQLVTIEDGPVVVMPALCGPCAGMSAEAIMEEINRKKEVK